MGVACVTDEQIVAYLDGTLDAAARAALETHVDGCTDCRELLAALARDAAAPPDARAERYEIIEQLGSGGMGAVYLARDTELDRRVALKILHPRGGARVGETLIIDADRLDEPLPARGDRLRIEALALARLSHPNIVSVYDVGELDGEVFIAMELVAGDTLREWLDAQARSLHDIISMFEAAGQGLAAAHEAGVVHRDFKPENVLIGDDDQVRVSDFGLAKLINEPDHAPTGGDDGERDGAAAQASCVAGTPAYMAPELLAGGAANAASDQYSFCVALHEAVYGERPPLPTPGPLRAAQEPRPACEPRRRHVPRWLRTLIARGLSPAPRKRFGDMTALVEGLARGRRRRRRLQLGGAIAMVSIAVAGGLVWVGAHTGTNRTGTTSSPVASSPPRSKPTLAQLRPELAAAKREIEHHHAGKAIARLNRVVASLGTARTKPARLLLARSLALRCRAWRKHKDPSAAGDDGARAAALYRDILGATHKTTLRVLVRAAMAMTAARRWRDAEPLVTRALALSKRRNPVLPGKVFILMSELGRNFVETRRPAQAVEVLRNAAAYFEAHKLPFVTLHVGVYESLAHAQWAAGMHRAAIASARRALAVSTAKTPAPLLVRVRSWLAEHH